MKKKMRVMTEKPLNAETPIENLRTWITDNAVFFKRNQGQFKDLSIQLSDWRLGIEGLVKKEISLTFADIKRLPRAEVADTLECSGNSRSLLKDKASGNPWTVGGVGNAVWQFQHISKSPGTSSWHAGQVHGATSCASVSGCS